MGTTGRFGRFSERPGGMEYWSVLRCSAQCVRYRWLPLHAGLDAAPTALPTNLRGDASSRSVSDGCPVHAVDGGNSEGCTPGTRQRSRAFRDREGREHIHADRSSDEDRRLEARMAACTL